MRNFVYITALVLCLHVIGAAQKSVNRKVDSKPDIGSTAFVIDQRLSVLRTEPGLYTEPLKRLNTGAEITVFEEKEADGVSFYSVADNTAQTGWIQSEAIAGSFRKNDDDRLARLIFGSSGFVQVERIAIFLKVFENSSIRPTILLLFGDLLEDYASEISAGATETLDRREMAAAQAPVHSFYLNLPELDPYRALGIKFLFNSETNILHYNGDAWFEITRRFPESSQSIEARERIKSLTAKMKAKK